MVLAEVAMAFAPGAVPALSPGHGKAIVAAYLVGSSSTSRHAALLRLMVTFTHTVTVFFLGFATLLLSRFVMPEKIYPLLARWCWWRFGMAAVYRKKWLPDGRGAAFRYVPVISSG